MPDDRLPLLEPREAIAYFRGKGLRPGFAWQDVWQEEHARAFTVAKAMSRDILETIRAAVDQAIARGETMEQFRAQLTPVLQAKGWWGRQRMIDPATGLAKTVQLGSPRRLKIIYETNLRMAQAAGRWEQIQRTKHMLPYLRYTAVMDERTRPEHAEWHGTILPVDDPWWDTHYPPCGWNCRCTTIQLDAATIADRGWAISDAPPPPGTPTLYVNPRTGQESRVPAGIDPGFAYNVGKAWLGGIEPPPLPEPALPALEPGVDRARVPPDAPSPPSLLPPDATPVEAVDAFLDGLSADSVAAEPVITIAGDEIADAQASIDTLRADTRAFLAGQPPVANPQLGAMSFTKRGAKKAIAHSAGAAGAEKLRASAAVPAVIARGTARVEDNVKQVSKPFVGAYARIEAPILFAGEVRDMEVIAEQNDGRWRYYDHRLAKAPSGRPHHSGGVSRGDRASAEGLADPKPGDRSGASIAANGAEVERDRIITDPSGWPLPIGRGWFRDAGGRLAVPAGDRRRVLGLVGRAIAAPREIRLRWVTGADGSPMLFRRYIADIDGLAVVVDVGRAGWRFATARDAGFDLSALMAGDLIWSAN